RQLRSTLFPYTTLFRSGNETNCDSRRRHYWTHSRLLFTKREPENECDTFGTIRRPWRENAYSPSRWAYHRTRRRFFFGTEETRYALDGRTWTDGSPHQEPNRSGICPCPGPIT